MSRKFLVSACLVGFNCKYNAGNNLVPAIRKHFLMGDCIPVCPELVGGLAVPRPRVEISGGDGMSVFRNKARIVNVSGRDVTRQCINGTAYSLYLALRYGVRHAVLKKNSPCCGKGRIFDGTFNGRVIRGNGLLTCALLTHGIKVSSL